MKICRPPIAALSGLVKAGFVGSGLSRTEPVSGGFAPSFSVAGTRTLGNATVLPALAATKKGDDCDENALTSTVCLVRGANWRKEAVASADCLGMVT